MSDDQRLKQTVLDELKWEPSVNEAHIGVTAKEGVVTLTGHVKTFAEKYAAEKATRRINDVKAIAEEIEVRPPSSVKHDDEEIAAAALERLRWDAAVPSGAIKARVEKGWVTVTGEVEWRYQREAALSDVRGLWGVTGVSDDIVIKPRPDASDIKDKILAALNRSWLGPASIAVTAEGGKVHLSGKVNSWCERDEATCVAWAAPGTTAVENDIAVN